VSSCAAACSARKQTDIETRHSGRHRVSRRRGASVPDGRPRASRQHPEGTDRSLRSKIPPLWRGSQRARTPVRRLRSSTRCAGAQGSGVISAQGFTDGRASSYSQSRRCFLCSTQRGALRGCHRARATDRNRLGRAPPRNFQTGIRCIRPRLNPVRISARTECLSRLTRRPCKKLAAHRRNPSTDYGSAALSTAANLTPAFSSCTFTTGRKSCS
jgi:hypothetical protein